MSIANTGGVFLGIPSSHPPAPGPIRGAGFFMVAPWLYSEGEDQEAKFGGHLRHLGT